MCARERPLAERHHVELGANFAPAWRLALPRIISNYIKANYDSIPRSNSR